MTTIEEIAVLTKRKPATRRQRKAEQRTRNRQAIEAARAEYERLKTIEDERIAEDQAPAAQRATIKGRTADSIRADRAANREPTEIVIREPIAPPDPKRGGYRRANPLFAMNRRGKGRTVTHDHLRGAERLRTDYETGILRAASPRSGLSGGEGGHAQDEEYVWLAAAERYRCAVAAIPVSLRGMVEAIVLIGQSVPWIARAIGQSEETTVGLIVAALDALADHYWPGRETRAKTIERAIAALQPLGFDFAVSAIGEVIPQDRIGKGRPSVIAQ